MCRDKAEIWTAYISCYVQHRSQKFMNKRWNNMISTFFFFYLCFSCNIFIQSCNNVLFTAWLRVPAHRQEQRQRACLPSVHWLAGPGEPLLLVRRCWRDRAEASWVQSFQWGPRVTWFSPWCQAHLKCKILNSKIAVISIMQVWDTN